MKKYVRVLALFIFVCVFGFSTPTKAIDISEAEESIKQTLLDYAKAWNKKDAEGVIALYHDDADIMTGGDKKKVSKKQYGKIIPKRCNVHGKIKFGVPKIAVTGEKAKVNVEATFKRTDVNYIFYMVLQDNRWLIMVQEY